jgi:hypothetical protein
LDEDYHALVEENQREMEEMKKTFEEKLAASQSSGQVGHRHMKEGGLLFTCVYVGHGLTEESPYQSLGDRWVTDIL